MSGTIHPNTQYLPPVAPAQHTLAVRLAALLPKLSGTDQATLQEALLLVAAAQRASYPP